HPAANPASVNHASRRISFLSIASHIPLASPAGAPPLPFLSTTTGGADLEGADQANPIRGAPLPLSFHRWQAARRGSGRDGQWGYWDPGAATIGSWK
ncbi:unnamed protein product, partial [Urochloa humidicola]